MSSDACWQLNHRDVVCEMIDGELIIMNSKTGKYFSSDGVGPFVWSCVTGGLTGKQTITAVAERCRVPATAIADDIQAFIESLEREDLIRDGSMQPAASVAECSEGLTYSKPVLEIYSDMQDLLLLDPIHDVSEDGWPMRPEDHRGA